MGPIKKNNNNNNNNKIKRNETRTEDCAGRNFFLIFFLSLFLSHIYENRTVGIRRIKNESALRNEGHAWVQKKTRDFTENSGKSSENPNF